MQGILLVVSVALIIAVGAQTRREQGNLPSKILRGAAGVVLFSTLNLIPLAADQTLTGTTVVVIYVCAALVAIALYSAGRAVAHRE